MRRPSSKPCRRSTRPVSAWACPTKPPTGHDLTEVPRRPRPELLRRPRGARATLVQSRPSSAMSLATCERHPETGPGRFLQAGPERRPRPHLRQHSFPNAPAVKQAEAKLLQARPRPGPGQLNLRYCDIVSEIDGVVTRRNVNPGNNVQVGQSLMAVRSLTEIWIDANFKETQLADLRIGQRVRCEVDMYGSRREFEGRITGFTMGTGSDARPAAAAERHRQLRQDRPAAAGPDRADRLRSRQGSLVRRPVGRRLRVLQGTAHGAERREGLAAVPLPLSPQSDPAASRTLATLWPARSDDTMSSVPVLRPRSAARRSTPGSSPPQWSCPRSWRCWTPRSPTSRCAYIAGGLSASNVDSEWVITSYLAANATILPI